MYSWYILSQLSIGIGIGIGSDHVHPVMIMVCTSSDGCFQQDNTLSKSSNHPQLASTVPNKSNRTPIDNLWDVVKLEIPIMDALPANVQELCDAIVLMWTDISKRI